MPKKQKKTKQEVIEKTIVDTDCQMTIGGKGLLIKWHETTYIANVELVSQLLSGELTKKDGTKAKAIKLGILTDDGIENDTEVFLTLKGKAMYFVPEEGQVLITSKEDVEKLTSGEWTYVKLGMFQ